RASLVDPASLLECLERRGEIAEALEKVPDLVNSRRIGVAVPPRLRRAGLRLARLLVGRESALILAEPFERVSDLVERLPEGVPVALFPGNPAVGLVRGLERPERLRPVAAVAVDGADAVEHDAVGAMVAALCGRAL